MGIDVDAARALSAHGSAADRATNERRVRDMREMVTQEDLFFILHS